MKLTHQALEDINKLVNRRAGLQKFRSELEPGQTLLLRREAIAPAKTSVSVYLDDLHEEDWIEIDKILVGKIDNITAQLKEMGIEIE